MVRLHYWLLRFGSASAELQKIVGEFGEWMANRRPPWAAYRVLMLVCLIILDKYPGVRPFRVGETWRRMLTKCLLAVMGAEAKKACGTGQLCRCLDAKFERGFTYCGSCDISTPTRRTGVFS